MREALPPADLYEVSLQPLGKQNAIMLPHGESVIGRGPTTQSVAQKRREELKRDLDEKKKEFFGAPSKMRAGTQVEKGAFGILIAGSD